MYLNLHISVIFMQYPRVCGIRSMQSVRLICINAGEIYSRSQMQENYHRGQSGIIIIPQIIDMRGMKSWTGFIKC